MKGFGHKARKALKRYATAVWRENQPPFFAFAPNGKNKTALHVLIMQGPQGLAAYAAGIIGEHHPREYGFVLPGDAGEPCFLPVEVREHIAPAQPSAQHSHSGSPMVRNFEVAEKALAEIRAKISATDAKKRACA